MEIKSRLIKLLILLVSVFLIPIVCDFIITSIDGDHGDPMFIGIMILILVVNIIYSNSILKLILWKKILTSIIITISSFGLCVLLVRLNIINDSSWGVRTFVVSNPIFTVLLWELFYQCLKKIDNKKLDKHYC